jgi:RimJ/RimL family protein N-acetyltransferase
LYGLRLRTPRLELRLPLLEELDALAELAALGVHDPQEMPFLVPWTDAPAGERARGVMQHHWRQLAEWTPQDWQLPLTVLAGGAVVGVQSMAARDFAVAREVSSGSWLGSRHQGQGIGTEMRAAMLHLAFAGLGAESAVSGAFLDNHRSLAVSRKLGYRPNGTGRWSVRDAVRIEERLVLDRAGWLRHRIVPVEDEGLTECLPLFGSPGALDDLR